MPLGKMEDEVRVRKAAEGDLAGVMGLIRRAVRHLDEKGIFQWDEIYPDEATLRADTERGELYLLEKGGRLAAVFVVNGECNPEYMEGEWEHPDAAFRVIHRLCVDPAVQNGGVGSRALREAEAVIRRAGFETVRLDAFTQNPAAQRMYEKQGYRKAGEITLRKGRFYLYEKKLEKTAVL